MLAYRLTVAVHGRRRGRLDGSGHVYPTLCNDTASVVGYCTIEPLGGDGVDLSQKSQLTGTGSVSRFVGVAVCS